MKPSNLTLSRHVSDPKTATGGCRHLRNRTVAKQARKPIWSIASSPPTRTDESGDIIAKTRHTPTLWRIDRNKSAITREVTRTSVKDHNAFKIDFVAAIPW